MSAATGTKQLVVVGAGNMGGAMVRRWIESGACSPGGVLVIDPWSPRVPDAVEIASGFAGIDRRWHGADVLLAVKPQQLGDVAADVAALTPATVISILAGVTHARLRDVCGTRATIRAMPNMPVAIGHGVVALHGDVAPVERQRVDRLMMPLGLVEWIDDEALLDAVTAVSGCGPAFTYRFVDAMARAGVALGLDPAQAARLAAATVEGSAMALQRSNEAAGVLADRVASPGGSTREGLNVLDGDAALDRLIAATLAAAYRRNGELARLG